MWFPETLEVPEILSQGICKVKSIFTMCNGIFHRLHGVYHKRLNAEIDNIRLIVIIRIKQCSFSTYALEITKIKTTISANM